MSTVKYFDYELNVGIATQVLLLGTLLSLNRSRFYVMDCGYWTNMYSGKQFQVVFGKIGEFICLEMCRFLVKFHTTRHYLNSGRIL